ncbi:MAG TPA: BadF/BadG/BcrA/BcrD ATPase family protein [Candidatus Limnocylindrales bacterium]|nr:BadF/BadG/BcrA/BcrD ATPase family protein [Candidatus Limnocylindrales bacterium]
MDPRTPVLVGVDAGATKAVAIAIAPDGTRLGRAEGPGANPKRHGLDAAADRIVALAREAVGTWSADPAAPDLLFVAGAGIDRPEHARQLEAALALRLPRTSVLVVNDTLAALRAATPDCVGLAIPVSTGGNVLGRGPDGRVTDRGHGIFGGGYVLGALAARAARAARARSGTPPRHTRIGADLRRTIAQGGLTWRSPRRPGPEVAHLGAAVVLAAQSGDPYPARMVDRWCRRVTVAVGEEVARLGLGDRPAVLVYGGLMAASPWLADRIREAVREAAPRARMLTLDAEPVDGAALLAIDAWRGTPVAWNFTPRR